MKSRFLTSAIKTAQSTDVVMPWARGARRASFIAKRTAATRLRKSA